MKGKRNSAVLLLILLLIFVEIGSRAYFSFAWDIPFFRMDKLIWHFYPELRKLEQDYDQSADKIKVLVLGGSVVDSEIYCNLEQLLPESFRHLSGDSLKVQVYNLASSGHTTLDSRNKYQEVKHLDFDYIFFYHGINDSRANNIPDKYFDIDYNHFAYYKLVNILNSHPEKRFTVLPFAIHFICSQLQNLIIHKPQVPPFYIVKDEKVLNKQYWNFGSEIKTSKSFHRNLSLILNDVSNKADTKLILFTYAHYHPKNYSLKSFERKELDYAEQKWPTEIYGQPDNVVKAIRVHNEVISTFKDHPNVIFCDFNSAIPNNATYFNDICHLTGNGCSIMSDTLAKLIAEDK